MKKLFSTLTLGLALLVSQAVADDALAPSFTLANPAGTEVTLPSKQDGVDLYLFWATWCPYCKALMPHLQSIQLEYGNDVRIYALHVRDEDDPVTFMQENGYDFQLLPKADPVMELYGVQPIPAVILIDKAGKIRFNLYETIFQAREDFKTLSHKQKASRQAPYWAARIRQTIDQILAETGGN